MNETKALKDTFIIFFPFSLQHIRQCYLQGDVKSFDDYVKIFFITELFELNKLNCSINLLNESTWNENENRLKFSKNWIYIEVNKSVLTLKKLKVDGNFKELSGYHIIWINYDFYKFSQCELLTSVTSGVYSDRSYFKYFKEKISYEKEKRTCQYSKFKVLLLGLLSSMVLKLSKYNIRQFTITKYFNIALHVESYLYGFYWAMKSINDKKKFDIKVINFLLSVFLDMFLGIMFLNWLNSKISLNSSSTFFLLTAESVVNSIKDLINWLSGDPIGLKLNWAFNKVLAAFFLFHIDIWWTFIAYLKPLIHIIFQIFLKLGLLGVTFQASITADLLALVSFHVYCIYAYAAKLYSIQVSSLISLWRLFLGRKKNPLRSKVDSCKYSPEQLCVGTLGFTILLFLLPTTLLYYIVFTFIRLVILMMQAVLMLIRHLNQILPVYSTILWIIRSPKISAGIEIIPNNEPFKSDFILMSIKPVTYSWWETVTYFMPDCAPKPGKIDVSHLLSSLISGQRIYPI